MGLFDAFKKKFDSVSPSEAQQRIDGGAMLLDVRESVEYQAFHAPAAKLISLGVLSRRLKELPKEREILVVCNSGNRSAQAANLLAKEGFQVTNVKGGMVAWQASGLKVIRK
ncbi:MAG: rhodanese-like domain-containing protein [Aquiluna sp.]